MDTKKLGCLSPLAIIATVITIIVIVAVAILNGNNMFSAGSLNAQPGETLGGVTSHADIGSACTRCHASLWGRENMTDRCTACHTVIQSQLMDQTSLHGAMNVSLLECRACHPEHNGPDAPLTVMDVANFPHNSLGFSLDAHSFFETQLRPFNCADCHGNDISKFDAATCQDCHKTLDAVFAQAHIIEYGSDCLACHDGIDSFGEHFNHRQTSFPLEGEHAQLQCAKCHLNARTRADFKNGSTDCAFCHQKDDAHAGQFGTDCGACHSPKAWEPASFDHNRSAFKLEGAHAKVACENCHQNNVFKGTPADCASCHLQDDAHAGRFGTECGACHSPKAWEPASFDHNRSAFKLEGAHARVACEDCHQNNVFKGTPATCAGCHGDPGFHAGMFAGQSCNSCHNINSWSPARYNGPHPGIADEGGRGVNHGGGTCRDCHTVNLREATCDKCHRGNNFEGGGDD